MQASEEKHEVLNHGYVKLIDAWGDDRRIVEAARMSTDKGFIGWGPQHATNCAAHEDFCGVGQPKACTCEPKPGDEKLLKFLYDHKHMTPFEMGGLTIEVQAPIFVFREWHRHRTQSYNELSARYTALPNMYYVPSLERVMNSVPSKTNKQSSEQGVMFSEQFSETVRAMIEEQNKSSRLIYEQLLLMGIAREVARVVVPVSQYSRMRASANLRNWLAFLTLRLDKGAQWEIRQYAGIVADLIAEKFPITFGLFNVTGPTIK